MSAPLHRNRPRHRSGRSSLVAQRPVAPNVPIVGVEAGLVHLLEVAHPHLRPATTGTLVIEPTEALIAEAKRQLALDPSLEYEAVLQQVYKSHLPLFPFRLPVAADEFSASLAGVVFCQHPGGPMFPSAPNYARSILDSAALMGFHHPSKVHLAVTDNASQAEIFSATYALAIRLVRSQDGMMGIFEFYTEEEAAAPHSGAHGRMSPGGIFLPPASFSTRSDR